MRYAKKLALSMPLDACVAPGAKARPVPIIDDRPDRLDGRPRRQPHAGCPELFRIDNVTTTAGLAALRSTWEALSADADMASPFNSWLWQWAWWEVFGAGKDLHICVVWDGPRAIAIAPFYGLRYGRGPVALRVLLPLGYGNDLTERMEPLVATGYRAAALAALAAHLACVARWDLLVWQGAASDDLSLSLHARQRATQMVPYAVRSLPPTWEAFVAGLSTRTRANLRYYPNRLARHGHTARVRMVADPDALGPALATFVRLHAARAAWSGGSPHSDRFAHARHRAFLALLAPALAAQGQFRAALLAVDGRDVAAQLVFEHAGTLSLYYSGVDPAWLPYGVGFQLTAACLRDAMEHGIRRLDWLHGSTGHWKQRWGTTEELVPRLAFVGDTLRARTAYVVYAVLRGGVYDRAGRARIAAPYGVAAEYRLLQGLAALLRQPRIG